MSRGFEVITKYQDKGINLPERQTKNAAGYDFEAAEDFILPSIWKLNFIKILWNLWHQKENETVTIENAQKELKPLLIPTGVKAFMGENEYLLLANRSSNPLKRRMILPNGVGIIDADYYNNPSNEGAIFFQMLNFGITDIHISKGERIGQGIFMPFLTVDNEKDIKKTRDGGFGSTKK